MSIIVVFLLILCVIVISQKQDNGPGLVLAEQPFRKLLCCEHIKLAMHEESHNDFEFPLQLSAMVFPSTKNTWTDSIVSRVAVLDQGQFGSCTANALSYAWQQAILRSNGSYFLPSRTFWYAESRLKLGDANYSADNGSTIAASAWTLSNKGAIAESAYGYNAQNIRNAVPAGIKVTADSLKRATRKVVFSGNQNTTIANFKTEINSGRVIMIGVLVYSSFMSSSTLRTGVLPMPNTRRERLLGGHAIGLSGWNDTTRRFSFRNSWGTGVGAQGLFTIPYDYVCNGSLAGDPWVVL